MRISYCVCRAASREPGKILPYHFRPIGRRWCLPASTTPAQAELVEALAGVPRVIAMSFHTYILRCADGSYYVGHSDDLERRLAEHQAGAHGGYTSRRRPVTLLWTQSFQTRDEAFAAERQLKGWSRAKKEALIAGDWALVRALARARGVGGASSGASTSSA